MRDAEPEIEALGARIVAVGTGDERYARGFAEDEQISFPVLVDDDAVAARAASIKRGSAWTVLGPRTYGKSLQTWRAGHRVHKPGKRTFQLGATFVVGPGGRLRYEHLDPDTATHAPIPEVLAALRN